MPKGEVERPLGSSAKLYLEQLSLLECDKDRHSICVIQSFIIAEDEKFH